jgi:hypothetical protein
MSYGYNIVKLLIGVVYKIVEFDKARINNVVYCIVDFE